MTRKPRSFTPWHWLRRARWMTIRSTNAKLGLQRSSMPCSARRPNHPGVTHYLIHSFDYPRLAHLALPAARRYAGIAPASAHAQHMPSHIFTRLGQWDEFIASNRRAEDAARDYAVKRKLAGSWDERFHAMDYLMYAYLQKGMDGQAKALLDSLQRHHARRSAQFQGRLCSNGKSRSLPAGTPPLVRGCRHCLVAQFAAPVVLGEISLGNGTAALRQGDRRRAQRPAGTCQAGGRKPQDDRTIDDRPCRGI